MRGVLAQEIHHRVKNNLQTVASLLRLQARDAENVDPRKALEDSVNRILAIAAVHEVLTEQRDEDVDLAELLDRLRAMLVQGVGAGREVTAELEPVSLAGQRATALALVFSELLGNALEHGGAHVRVELRGEDGEVVLAIADDGARDPRRAAEGHRPLDRPRARPRRARRDARARRQRRHARRACGSRPELPRDPSTLVGEMRILVAEDETIIRLDLRGLLERAGLRGRRPRRATARRRWRSPASTSPTWP